MSGRSTVGPSPILYPSDTLVIVPLSGIYVTPRDQVLGYMQYPDGRRAEAKELNNLREQLAKEREDNQVLKLAWQTAHFAMHISRTREAEVAAELQKAHAELQQQREKNQQHVREMRSMQRKIGALSDNVVDAERRLQFNKLMHRQNPSTVTWKRKSTSAGQLTTK